MNMITASYAFKLSLANLKKKKIYNWMYDQTRNHGILHTKKDIKCVKSSSMIIRTMTLFVKRCHEMRHSTSNAM